MQDFNVDNLNTSEFKQSCLDTKRAIPKAALYEALAEEATELAQASLKMARIMRRENPTPVTIDDAYDNLIEEFCDLLICCRVLELETDTNLIMEKTYRWQARINKKGE